MKKLLMFVLSMLSVVTVYGVENLSYRNYGFYNSVDTPDESVVTVSSTAYSTDAAVAKGVVRYYQNTGSTSVMKFYVLASSNTTGLCYMPAGQAFIEDTYFGTVYFKVVPASASTTLYRCVITNK